MENQVQILEDLLARVQRNRMRMDGGAKGTSRMAHKAGAAVKSGGHGDASGLTASEAIIDLVNPTSVVPGAPTSNVPQNSPAWASTSAQDKQSDARPEDDFSSVAPVSVAPTAPTAHDDAAVFASVSPSPVATAVASSAPGDSGEELDILPPSMLPVSEPGMTKDDAADSENDDELVLVDTDRASLHPGIIEATTSMSARYGGDAGKVPSVQEAVPPETRSFERTASASGDIVSIPNTLPEAKSWTISAVLHRAWALGKNE